VEGSERTVNDVLDGKVVIITGASSGIGAATARELAAHGCQLTLAARSKDKLTKVAASIPGEHLAVPTDVTDYAAVKDMVARTIERFGRVDVLFANAGIYVPGPVDEGDPAAWSALMDVNVDGVMNCTHAVLPQMKSQGSGDIIVTSSISGLVDIDWEPVYSASKHAVQGFVHTIRLQLRGMGIRVSSIAPGQVANELWGITDPAEIEAKTAGERTFLRSEDIARAVAFMLSQPPHVTIRNLVILPQAQDI
jgi:ribitol 2-dehydrogenase